MKTCTHYVVREVMRIVAPQVRLPKCVRDGLVKPNKIMKKFIFLWEATDNCTYWSPIITPFECEDLDAFILKSVERVKESEYGAEVLGTYIQKDEVENLYHNFYELEKWFEHSKFKE